MRNHRRAVAALFAGACLALLALVWPRPRGESRPPRNFAAVEPICAANIQANERILAGGQKEVKEGKLKTAAVRFTKAAAALERTRRELADPQPVADKDRLAKWFGYVKGEVGCFEATVRKLMAADKAGAERMSVKLTRQAALAGGQVLAFEINYGRAEASRFT